MNRLRHIAFAMLALLTITVSGAMAYMQTHGGHFLSIQTGSMVPTLKKGDVVVVTRVPARDLRVGDVITFVNPRNTKQTITHRLVKVPGGQGMDQSFRTKGDANPAADTPISGSAILGKARFHVPLAGFVLDFMRTPLGLALLVYLPALLIVYKELRRLAAYYKQQQPYVLPARAAQLPHTPFAPKSSLAPKAVTGIVTLAVATALVIAPAYAALSAQATLAGNTISSAPLGIADHILIRRLDLRCGRTHTDTASQRPVITLYNPTNKPIAAGNWHIDDNSGRMVTLPAGTVLQARHQYVITPLLRTKGLYGIQFAGDRIALIHANGVTVDGVSWGSDTSQSPTLPALSLGTTIRRAPPRQDTNTAADFRIIVNNCAGAPVERNLTPVEPGTFTMQETGDSIQ